MKPFLLAIAILLTLTAIAQRFVQSTPNIAGLIAINPLNVHSNVFVAGSTNPGDGGGGIYIYKTTSAVTNADFSIVASTYSTGFWHRVIPNTTTITNGSGGGETYITTYLSTNVQHYLTTNVTTAVTNIFQNSTNIAIQNLISHPNPRPTETLTGTNPVIDWFSSFLFRWILSGDSAPIFANIPQDADEHTIQIDVVQPAGAGYGLTWDTSTDIYWPNGTNYVILPENTTNKFAVQWNGEKVRAWLVDGTSLDIPIGANPTASLGLTAINGSSTNFMRSDGSQALDVTISPPWTGLHTFSRPNSTIAMPISLIGTSTNDLSALMIPVSLTGQSGSSTVALNTFVNRLGNWTDTTTTRNSGFYLATAVANSTVAAIAGSYGNAILGKIAGGSTLVAAATNGFATITGTDGIPVGVPLVTSTTTGEGAHPITIDYANDVFYFYSSGAWHSLAPGGGVSGLTTGYLPYATSATTLGDSTLQQVATNKINLNAASIIYSPVNVGGDNRSVGIGQLALQNATAASVYNNTAVGYKALATVTTGGSTAFGASAGYSLNTGTGNTYIGESAGYGNVTSARNTLIGEGAGYYQMAGDNVFVGYYANAQSTNSTRSVVIGSQSLTDNQAKDLTEVVIIGHKTYTNTVSALSNAISIGAHAYPQASNTAQIGTNGITVLYLNGTVGWFRGSGTPEGAVAAPVGSFFSREDGSTDTALYKKETGAATSTGWVAIAAGGGGGGGAPVGTVVNTGASVATQIPIYTDATGTNINPSAITISALTNLLSGSITSSNLTAARVVVSAADKSLASSVTTTTELGYVSGVTSAIQTQLNTKAPTADPVFTSSLQLPNGAAPTTDAFGELAADNDAWAASRGALQFFDGTANTFIVGALTSDAPSNGQVPTWNTGGTITWETPSAGGGGSAPTNTLVSLSTPATANGVAYSSGTVGTNALFATGVTIGSATNLTVTGDLTIGATNVIGSIAGKVTRGSTVRSLKFVSGSFTLVDGTGVTIPNSSDYTLNTYMVPQFSGTDLTNQNFIRFSCRVPSDIDTAVAMTASLTVELGGADTAAQIYHVGVVSIANSSVVAGTPTTYVVMDIAADASGASTDIESVNNVTLTGWAGTLTANQWMLIELRRSGSVDASTVASRFRELEIFYTTTQ